MSTDMQMGFATSSEPLHAGHIRLGIIQDSWKYGKKVERKNKARSTTSKERFCIIASTDFADRMASNVGTQNSMDLKHIILSFFGEFDETVT